MQIILRVAALAAPLLGVACAPYPPADYTVYRLGASGYVSTPVVTGVIVEERIYVDPTRARCAPTCRPRHRIWRDHNAWGRAGQRNSYWYGR